MASHADIPIVRYEGTDLPFKLIGGLAASCFIGALLTDIVYARDPEMVWTTFSIWAITIGLVLAGIATLVGLVDRVVHGRFGLLRPYWSTLLGFALVVVVEIFNAFVHSRDAYESVVPEGITLSIVAVALLVLAPIVGRTHVRSHSRETH